MGIKNSNEMITLLNFICASAVTPCATTTPSTEFGRGLFGVEHVSHFPHVESSFILLAFPLVIWSKANVCGGMVRDRCVCSWRPCEVVLWALKAYSTRVCVSCLFIFFLFFCKHFVAVNGVVFFSFSRWAGPPCIEPFCFSW